MRSETVALETVDGVRLAADVVRPGGPARGAAVVCHPHPLYGGDRHNPVVGTLVEALAGAGLVTVRFDFRGAGGSAGAHGGGTTEPLDVLAALDAALALRSEPADAGARAAAPVVLAGYSFGAVVALAVLDGRVDGWLGVAPPLRAGGSLLGDGVVPAGADPRPKHLVVAGHDQFAPPPVVRDATAGWASTSVAEAPMADHFLAGAHRTVAAEAVAFVERLRVGSG